MKTDHEAAILRCMVLAARHHHALFTGPCRSTLECERCYMPADSANKPCELCGWEKIVPLQDHGDDPLWNRREARYEVRA